MRSLPRATTILKNLSCTSLASLQDFEIDDSGTQNIHFVESPALAPPEVHIDLAAQQLHEAEIVIAASQPLPDDDDEEIVIEPEKGTIMLCL
ncbi:hypothetical protein QYF36_019384 [Acer negundo]|nr:hypothetical protein QYF36_019384 [Acer negundo]